MKAPTYAVCDIGTNSVRLMLSDADKKVVEKRLITTRIGDELHRTGLLSKGGMERTAAALLEYKEAATAHNLPLWAFATSAVRDALNKDEFLRMAFEHGIIIDVIDGEKEGELGFMGVGAKGVARLIDIGGGSTEMACGVDGKVDISFSAPVGCVRALDRFGQSKEGLSEVRRWLREATVTVRGEAMSTGHAAALLPKNAPVYAVSGTATSIASFAAGVTERYDGDAVNGVRMTRADIEKITDELSRLTPKERCAIPVLGKRGDLILLGASLLLECMELMETDAIIASDSDNMDGYLKTITKSL